MPDTSSISERFTLDDVILGLASDLNALRAGEISIDDAKARAELGKQILNGVRLVIRGQQFLEKKALPVR